MTNETIEKKDPGSGRRRDMTRNFVNSYEWGRIICLAIVSVGQEQVL